MVRAIQQFWFQSVESRLSDKVGDVCPDHILECSKCDDDVAHVLHWGLANEVGRNEWIDNRVVVCGKLTFLFFSGFQVATPCTV